MKKFQVGDRVVGIISRFPVCIKGVEGTVRLVEGDSIGVIWDKNVGGHSLRSTCKDGYGWWVLPQHIEHCPMSLENK